MKLPNRWAAVVTCPYPLAFVGLGFTDEGIILSTALLIFGLCGYGARAFRIERFRSWNNWVKGAIGACLLLSTHQARLGDLTSTWLLLVLAMVLFLEGLRDVNYALWRRHFNA
jgi:hypothetical protein